jgi:hypothetical protein
MIDVVVGRVIVVAFLVPALLRPTLGRIILNALFVGGGVFNLAYTLPKTPESLVARAWRQPLFRYIPVRTKPPRVSRTTADAPPEKAGEQCI